MNYYLSKYVIYISKNNWVGTSRVGSERLFFWVITTFFLGHNVWVEFDEGRNGLQPMYGELFETFESFEEVEDTTR